MCINKILFISCCLFIIDSYDFSCIVPTLSCFTFGLSIGHFSGRLFEQPSVFVPAQSWSQLVWLFSILLYILYSFVFRKDFHMEENYM